MNERMLMRAGGTAAILSGIMGVVANIAHPRVMDFQNYSVTLLTEVAETDNWIPLHVVILFAIVFATIGLAAVARSVTGAGGVEWIALLMVVVAGAVSTMAIGIDGYAVKTAADSWFVSTSGGDASALAAASAMASAGWAMFMLTVIFLFGIAPLTIGWAMLAGQGYAKWVGWVGLVGGLAAIAVGAVGFIDGPSAMFFNFYLAVSLAMTIWVFVLGTQLWQKAGEKAAVPATA